MHDPGLLGMKKRKDKKGREGKEKGCCEPVRVNPLRIISGDHLNSVKG